MPKQSKQSKRSKQSKHYHSEAVKQYQFMFNSFPEISNGTLQVILPFPPNISASEIVDKRKKAQIMSKSPNAFMIYRMVFLDHLALLNHNLKMTDVSKLVSTYWRDEPDMVKETYKRIAQEVEQELNERRKKDVHFCRVFWKNSKLLERKQICESSKPFLKRNEQPDNGSGTKSGDTSLEYPVSHEGEGAASSFEVINNFSTHETQINSIDSENSNNPESVNSFGNIREFHDEINFINYFSCGNENMVDYYLQNFIFASR